MAGAAQSTRTKSTTTSRSVAAAVQARLSVGPTNDAYEQEADRVAERVAGAEAAGPSAERASGAASPISRLVRRRVRRRGEAEREEVQGHLQRQTMEDEQPMGLVQRQRGTAVEEEEAREARLQRREDEEQLQPHIQRQMEEEAVQMRSVPRMGPSEQREFPRLAQVEERLLETKGQGDPLPEDVRRSMEASFGADFTDVRIHTGPDAARLTRALNAEAFAHGRDIYFNVGRYEPGTVRGRNLLAHELTHVVQQQAAEERRSPEEAERQSRDRRTPEAEPPDREARQVEQRVEASRAEGGAETPAPEVEAEEPAAEELSAEEAASEALPPGVEEPPGEGEEAEEGEAPDGVGAYLRESTADAVAQKKERMQTLARHQKEAKDPKTKVEESEKAVEPPADEGDSRARASQVEAVDGVAEPEPSEERARSRFDETLEAAAPSTLDEVDKFKDRGKGRTVAESVRDVVAAETQKVKSTYEQIEETPAAEAPEVAEPLPDIEPAPGTPAVDPGEGVVGEVPAEHTDMSEFEEESDRLLDEEGISEEQLAMVDEGDLAEAHEDRRGLSEKVENAPAEVEAVERAERQRVTEELRAEEQQGRQEMQVARRRELEQAKGDQAAAKSEMEQKRQEVTDHINAIYRDAKEKVEKKLNDLEEKSLQSFEEGQRKASEAFEQNVNERKERFKDRRYSGLRGKGRWLGDLFSDISELPEMKRIFESEKRRFIAAIDRLIDRIMTDNRDTIEECKSIISDAKSEIEEYIDGLEPALKETGERAYGDMKEKLQALSREVDEKEKELEETLEAKREEAIKAIEEKIEKMKEEMAGLLSKIGNLLANAALKFFKWVLKKAGFDAERFVGIIDKGKTTIQQIVRDPLGFLGNLLAGVKGGIQQFMKNIKQHLVGGLVDWLTGVMSNLPIDLPDKWDLRGIIYLVIQIVGLTWQRIRTKLVKRLGERVVSVAEKSVDIIQRLVTEGPIALWKMIKQKAAEIKEKVMESIRGWAITQLVKQGIVRLLGMLNPAGAIVQAVLAIYNAVMFFIENWERITTFARTVVETITDIARGKVGVVVKAVENAMAQTIPIILNFIARLLNISGISRAISNAIKKVRRPIDRVVEKAIDKMVKLARKVAAKVKKAAGAVKEKVMAWWKARKSFTADDGKTHQLYYKGKGRSAELMVASDSPMQVEPFLTKALDAISKQQGEKKKRLTKSHTSARNTYNNLKSNEEKLKKTKDRKKQQPLQKKIQNQMTGLAGHLKPLIGIAEAKELPPPVLPPMVYGVRASSFTAEYINKDVPEGSEAGSYDGATLPGWRELQATGLTTPGGYVKMHLLPHRLGGDAADSNLVPASGPKVNTPFSHGIEKEAIDKKDEEPIWYKIDVSFHSEPNEAYPRSIVGKWGTYQAADGSWKKKSEPGGQYGKTSIGVPEVPTTLEINDPETMPGQIRSFLDIDYGFARIIVKIREQQGPFGGDNDLIEEMRVRHLRNQKLNRKTVSNFEGKMERLRTSLSENKGDVIY